MSDNRPKLMFATTSYAYVEQAFLDAGGFDRGRVEQKRHAALHRRPLLRGPARVRCPS